MHFIHKILCFEEFLNKTALFFKNLIFPDFRLIEPVARPIEIAIKNLVWICPFRSVLNCYWINRRHFRSIESNFRSIENCIESLLKLWVFTCSITFKLFQKHFSLSSIGQGFQSIFCCFPFLSSKAGKTLLSLLLHLFTCFMHFFMHTLGIFRTYENFGILMFSISSFKIDQWVFVVGCYKHDPYGLIWSIWCFGKNWNF